MNIKLLIAAFLLLLPMSVSAAGSAALDVSFSDTSVSAGEYFDVVVSFSPNGEQVDTIRSVVTFDPTLLEALSVNLAGTFNRAAPGNYINNSAGKISWGAFTLDGPAKIGGAFARITFFARADGDASVSISPDSRMISVGEEKLDSSALGSVQISIQGQAVPEQGRSILVVNSKSHPNETDWYANNSVVMEWVELKGGSSISEYLYALDKVSNTDPKISLSSDTSSVSLDSLEDGAYYFHIKGRQSDGQYTETTHRRVRIDTTAPNEIELTESDHQILEGESLWLTFGTTDETSGVLQYQVALNESEFQLQQSPLEVADLEQGTYFFRVAALDRAGNTTYQGKSVRVYPPEADLGRPEGYEDVQEIDAIALVQEKPVQVKESKMSVLITVMLVTLSVFGIIYVLKRKKIRISK